MYRATVLFLILPLVGFGFAWLATAAYAMFNPTHIIPLFNDPIYQKQMITLFAKRIYSKTITAREIINNTPESRIKSFLDDFKKKSNKETEKIEIPYTRQEIANYTGLRVETVIRTLSKMKAKKIVQIVNRKLIY